MTSVVSLSDRFASKRQRVEDLIQTHAPPEESQIHDHATGFTVAVAESCTAGRLATLIAEVPGSGEWFKGGMVACDDELKYRLLNVPVGPVITRSAAKRMASGVRQLLDADIGVATTGVEGPEPQEDQPIGTVFIGIADPSGSQALRLALLGSPSQIREAASAHALQQITQARKVALKSDGVPALAIPEGGFVIISPRPIEQVSIVSSDVAFTVAGDGETVTLELRGLNETASPPVLLSETGAEPMTPGEPGPEGVRHFSVATGHPLGITWDSARVSPVA
jgi:nicotinamide-nucleotide amidase